MKILRSGLCLLGLSVITGPALEGQTVAVVAGANWEALVNIQGEALQSDYRVETGFHGGASVEVLNMGMLSLRPGVVYQNSGAVFRGLGALTDNTFRLSYIGVPVDFKVSPLKYLYVFAGPEVQYTLTSSVPTEFRESLNQFVFRGDAGLGLQYGRFFLEGRYSLSLTSLTKDSYQIGGLFLTDVNQLANGIRATAGFSVWTF